MEHVNKELLGTALAAAQAAAKEIKSGAGQALDIVQKAPRSLVTNVDLAAERAILSIIKSYYPNHAILSEEMGKEEAESDYMWIIDPLDGTANFSSRIPIYATAVAVAHKGKVVAAAVIDPNRDEVFSAAKGFGAFVNGAKMHVGNTVDWSNVVVGYDAGYDEERASQTFDIISHLRPKVRNLRTIGSAVLGLTWVAAGRFDIYIHGSVAPWDMAAAWLFIEEAGGKISDLSANAVNIGTRALVASNPQLHGRVITEIDSGLVSFPN